MFILQVLGSSGHEHINHRVILVDGCIKNGCPMKRIQCIDVGSKRNEVSSKFKIVLHDRMVQGRKPALTLSIDASTFFNCGLDTSCIAGHCCPQ